MGTVMGGNLLMSWKKIALRSVNYQQIQDKHDDMHVFANRFRHPYTKENKNPSHQREVEAFTQIGSIVDKHRGTDGYDKARTDFLQLTNSTIPKPLPPTPRPGQVLQV